MFPALGFGARLPPNGTVSHEFFLVSQKSYCGVSAFIILILMQNPILRYYAHSYYHENEKNVLFLHFHGFTCKNRLLSKQYSCNCSKNISSISKWCWNDCTLFWFHAIWPFLKAKVLKNDTNS